MQEPLLSTREQQFTFVDTSFEVGRQPEASVVGSSGICRRVSVRATAAEREQDRSAQELEASLKAQGAPRHIRTLWAKTGNHVRTNKYTLLSFLPLALRLQFREVANVYFLFIAVFYAWERVSPVAGLSRFSGAVSLVVVLIYALILEAIQDIRRWRQDQSVNNTPCLILNAAGSRFESCRWRDVSVGDVVKVAAEQTFPADLLLLISERKDGLVYVETASLDGETNLKVFEANPSIVEQGIEDVLHAGGRQSVRAPLATEHVPSEFQAAEDQTVINRIRSLDAAGAQLECELPSASLYEWSGSVTFAHRTGDLHGVPVEAKQLLLRGAVLKKTRWAIGLVVYAGVQTKLQMNDEEGKDKTTRLLVAMQRALVWLLVLQLVASLSFAAAKSIWDSLYQTKHVYLLQEADAGWWEITRYTEHVVTFILLLCYMVPISLIMSIQTVKNIQRFFMDSDYRMYHAATNAPAIARSDKLQEELGQVNYIFSDKTGTLTCNEMELVKVCVDGSTYGDGAPHGLYTTKSDLIPERDEDTRAALSSEGRTGHHLQPVPAGSVIEVSEIIKEGCNDLALCRTTSGTSIGRVHLCKLKPLPNQQLNDDVGLYPLRRADRGKTAAIIEQRVLGGHRAGPELDRFWTLLAVCHQAEAEHPPADDALHVYREKYRNSAKQLMTEAYEMILADGDGAVDEALSKAARAVTCEQNEYPPERDTMIRYSAASPDDKALVEGAAVVGFRFLARRNGRLIVRVLGELREYKIISVIPFDSDRKRMSVITELVVPEVEALSRLITWMAIQSGLSPGTLTADVESRLASQPAFAALLRKRREIITATAYQTAPCVWTKGADSVMKPLLRSSDPASQRRIRDTWSAMSASAGLRTLVIASRVLMHDDDDCDAVDMAQWKQDVLDSMRLPKSRVLQRQTELFKQIEHRLELHGSTAVEDKLQDGVTEVLPKLHAAGIAVWILTGDKIGTATEIGYSAELLRADMNVVTIDEWTRDDENERKSTVGVVDGEEMDSEDIVEPEGVMHIRQLLAQILEELGEIEVSVGSTLLPARTASVNDQAGRFISQRPLHTHPLALVIHASALTIAMESVTRDSHGHPVDFDDARHTAAATVAGVTYPTTLDLFVAVAARCKTVICCRVSPKQKAEVVKMGKLHLGSPPGEQFSCPSWRLAAAGGEAVTLSIGDGANDVPMIKEAHIGVGISGHEGMQAVLASDFSIAQFAFLERLLLVHGRSNYFRTSKLILYFLYKSVLFSLTMTWMTLYNGYSGQSIYDGNIAGGFNLLFTFLPVMLLATLDRDLDAQHLVAHPALYAASREGHGFSGSNIASWALSGVWHSIVLFFGSIHALNDVDSHGRELTFWQMGVVLFSLVHVTVHLKIALVFSSWNLYSTITFLFSFSTWYWVWPIYSQIYSTAWTMNTELYRSFQIIHADNRVLLSMVLLPVACISVDVALKYWWRRVRTPDPANALRYQLQENGILATVSAKVAHKTERQQNQERRKITSEQRRMSFAAQNTMRLSSTDSPGDDTCGGISSSVLGRDDDDSNRRGAQITFGSSYLLPQETAAAAEEIGQNIE